MLISLTISIHAPRVGSDAQAAHQRKAGSHFNPRSPCGERQTQKCHHLKQLRFQSTLPVWGATTRA